MRARHIALAGILVLLLWSVGWAYWLTQPESTPTWGGSDRAVAAALLPTAGRTAAPRSTSPTPSATSPAPELRLAVTPEQLELGGVVPSDAVRAGLVGRVRWAYPDRALSDRLRVDPRFAVHPWLDAEIARFPPKLPGIERFRLRSTPERVELEVVAEAARQPELERWLATWYPAAEIDIRWRAPEPHG
jgi:hypothetical protein